MNCRRIAGRPTAPRATRSRPSWQNYRARRIVGWKIAATSSAGQQHIRVDGPLAGCLLSARAVEAGARVSLAGNNMKVAEAEFAFRMGQPLPKRALAYSVAEVLAAVASLHPAIEVPDSRYEDFTRVGAAQLIADVACACWFLIGPAARADWRARRSGAARRRGLSQRRARRAGLRRQCAGRPARRARLDCQRTVHLRRGLARRRRGDHGHLPDAGAGLGGG